jgi:hypothetical protein
MRGRRVLVGALAAAALAALPMSASADKPTCPDHPGCKTADDPDKNNPKFLITQLGNFNEGTDDTCVRVKPGRDRPC